jgi:hypothetical protein
MDIDLFGRFGRERHGKVIRMERKGKVVLPPVSSWSQSRVRITIPAGIPAGTHVIKAYCSAPTDAPAYAGNGVLFTKKAESRSAKFKRVMQDIFLIEKYSPKLDARKLAGALADEFGDWIEFADECPAPAVDEIRVERLEANRGIAVRAWYTSKCPCVVVHEVWHGDRCVKLLPLGLEGNDGSRREQRQVFPGLDPGSYRYTFRVVDSEEQQASASKDFDVD